MVAASMVALPSVFIFLILPNFSWPVFSHLNKNFLSELEPRSGRGAVQTRAVDLRQLNPTAEGHTAIKERGYCEKSTGTEAKKAVKQKIKVRDGKKGQRSIA